MSDKELKFIYREPDKVHNPTCLELVIMFVGIILFMGLFIGRW
jgi:hypothetical protein